MARHLPVVPRDVPTAARHQPGEPMCQPGTAVVKGTTRTAPRRGRPRHLSRRLVVIERAGVELGIQEELEERRIAWVAERPKDATIHDGHEARLDLPIATKAVGADHDRDLVLPLGNPNDPRSRVLHSSGVRPVDLRARAAEGEDGLERNTGSALPDPLGKLGHLRQRIVHLPPADGAERRELISRELDLSRVRPRDDTAREKASHERPAPLKAGEVGATLHDEAGARVDVEGGTDGCPDVGRRMCPDGGEKAEDGKPKPNA